MEVATVVDLYSSAMYAIVGVFIAIIKCSLISIEQECASQL